MSQHFDMRQRNNLLTGNELAAEIRSSSQSRRAFVTAYAYLETGDRFGSFRVSKVLNRDPEPNLRFALRRYEVETKFIENGWDVWESDLYGSVFKKGIRSLNKLEEALREFVDDFTLFDVSWKRDNPI